MTTISYCSLEEAWGEPIKSNDNSNNNSNNDNSFSYSGGQQAGSELHPMFNSNETLAQNQPDPVHNYELPSNTPFHNITPGQSNTNEVQHKSTVSNALVRLDDVNKDQLWNEFMKFLEEKKNNNSTSVQENFNTIKSINNDNSYIDLLILILFGIVIIFIMDSFVRLGKNMKN